MPKRTNDFQKLIATIETELAPLGAVVTESKLIKAKHSDVEREIDVAIESTVGHHEILIAMECRDHGRPANIQWIDALVGKYADLPVSNVIAVSRSGFSKKAHQKAEKANIRTITLEKAIEARCIPGEQTREMTIEFCYPTLSEMDVVLSKEDVSRLGSYTGNMREANVLDHNGQPMGVLRRFAKQVVGLCDAVEGERFMRCPPGRMPPINIMLPDGTKVIDEQGILYGLRRITIRRDMHLERETITLQAFKYLDVELLAGDAVFGDRRVHALFLYKENDRRVTLRLEGFVEPTLVGLS